MIRELSLVLVSIALFAAALGCRTPDAMDALLGVPSAADQGGQFLYAPIDLLTQDDAVVRVDTRDWFCSGTLISDELVLTAHHCVARLAGPGGSPMNLRPEEVRVEIGGGHWPWAIADVSAIIAPPCGYRPGHGDLAVLVLSGKLAGMPMLPIRLDGPARVGEEVEVVGFGQCLGSRPGAARVHRFGGRIVDIDDSTFWADAAMCAGDSGGPALNPMTGEVLGVASSAVMDADPRSLDLAFFTRLGIWTSVFAAARVVARGGDPADILLADGCVHPDASEAEGATLPPGANGGEHASGRP